MPAAWIRLVGPERGLEVFGVRFVGLDAENGRKLLLSLALIAAVVLVGRGVRALVWLLFGSHRNKRLVFWVRQAVRLLFTLALLIGIVSIWFNNPTRLATFLGLVSAGLAFALQRVVTAVAGYFVILRGKTFNVGDRIVMGGVRGDVLALGFMQTTIMEMGQPPPVQEAPPAMWVKARQYTGRIVTVSNAKIFDEPVYNYTRDFPYLFEEISIPVAYTDDRAQAERVLLEAARRHAVDANKVEADVQREMERRYETRVADMSPRVFWRITDNWLELTVRFLTTDHGVRDVKDAMSRDILQGLDQAGVGIASSTYDIVGLPPIRLVRDGRPGRNPSEKREGVRGTVKRET